MADALGLNQQGTGTEDPFVTDFLGQKAPLSLRGQVALPTVGAGAGAAPQTTAAGIAPQPPGAPLQPTSSGDRATSTFADLASAVGGSGDAGPGEGGAVGQGIDVAGGPANIGLSFGFGPGQISIGPTGTIGLGGRGDTTTSLLSSALNTALSAAGVPTSVNLPSLIAGLVGSPVLGIAAQLAGAAGVPFTIAALAHTIASMSPTSVTNLQAALADPNPEAQLSAAQALALAAGGAKGPTQGGPQNIGQLPFDNPVTNVNASTQAAPTTPAQNLADMTLTPTFADLANAAFGREDIGAPVGAQPTAPTADPTGQVSGGELGIGGDSGAPGPGDASDGGSGAP